MNRREFLGVGMLAAVAASAGQIGGAEHCAVGVQRRGCPFRLGVAGYTYVRHSLDMTLAELRKFDVGWLCAKDFHFPLKASDAELKALVAKANDFGVKLYGAGPITMKTPDEVKRAFDYCAVLGVPTVVGVPCTLKYPEKGGWKGLAGDRALCELCSAKADEYKLDFAIHNHGRNPETGVPTLYATIPDTFEMIRDLSRRMGFCVDIAYTQADGLDPATILRTYAPRVFDVHVRNTSILDNGSSGAAADVGKIDYVRVFRALKEIGYSGVCGLELANAFAKPGSINPGADPSWIPRSLGYFRGLMDALA